MPGDGKKSPTMEAFKRWIDKARGGDEASIKLVRTVLSNSAEIAPVADLLKMADHLYEMDLSPADQPNGE